MDASTLVLSSSSTTPADNLNGIARFGADSSVAELAIPNPFTRDAEIAELDDRPFRLERYNDADEHALVLSNWTCPFCNTTHSGGDPGMRPVTLLPMMAPTAYVAPSEPEVCAMEDTCAASENSKWEDVNPVTTNLVNTSMRYCGIQCFVLRTLIRYGHDSYVSKLMIKSGLGGFFPPHGDAQLNAIYQQQAASLQQSRTPFQVLPAPPPSSVVPQFAHVSATEHTNDMEP